MHVKIMKYSYLSEGLYFKLINIIK